MKKALSLALALILTLALGIPAFGANTPDIGIIGGADGPTALTIGLPTVAPLSPTAEEAADYLARNGGTPGQINVMVNGAFVPFDGVFPAILSGRTMVPLRQTLEFLGAEVSYDGASRTASVTGEGISFTHVIGTDTITMADGGVLTMDVASVIQNGSTLVPLRFFSQALGFDVFWDNGYRSAVVIDKEALIAKLDEGFTVFNAYAAKQDGAKDLSMGIREDLTLSMDIKLPDAVGGGATYKVSGELAIAMDESALNLGGSLDLDGLAPLVEQLVGLAPEQGLAEYLTPLTFELILGGDTLYCKAPLVGYVLSQSGYASPGEDAYYAVDGMGDLLTEAMAQSGALLSQLQPVSMGRTLYALLALSCKDCGVQIYGGTELLAQFYQLLFGDGVWTRSGSAYRRHLGMEELSALAEILTGEKLDLSQDGLTGYAMDITLHDNGNMEFSMEMTGPGVSFSMKGGGSGEKADFTGSLYIEDLCDVAFRVGASVREGAPALTPPAGATVVRDADLKPARP